MNYKIGDKIELKNKSIVEITFIGKSLEGYIEYGVGTAPIVVIPNEEIVRKIEE